MMWTGFIWFKMGITGGCPCEKSNEILDSIKARNFLLALLVLAFRE
jgi:hypothetical protein